MRQLCYILTASLLLTSVTAYGQDTVNNPKYLSLGTKSNGICFGNSIKYNGIRLNLWDKEFGSGKSLGKINGINCSFLVSNNYANGIEIGIIGSSSEKTVNGLQIGGLFATSKNANGFILGGLVVRGNKINGVGISFFNINVDTLNGVFLGLFAVTGPNEIKKIINGIAVGFLSVGAEKVRGITIAAVVCGSNELHGLSIAAINKTDNLHGLQIGLINYAGNNPKLLRWLPLINFHP